MTFLSDWAVIDLIQNGCVYTLAVLGCCALRQRFAHPMPVWAECLLGAMFGLVTIIGMLTPLRPMDGVLIDGRAIMIVLSLPFGGAWACAVTTAFAAVYRWHVGGIGATAGVVQIGLAAACGVAATWLTGRNLSFRHLVAHGLLAGIVTPLSCLLISTDSFGFIYRSAALPLFLIDFFGILLIGSLLILENRRHDLERALLGSYDKLARSSACIHESEARFRDLIEGSIQGVCVHSGFTPLFANDAFARMFGYSSRAEILALGSTLVMIGENEREPAIERYRSLMKAPSGSAIERICKRRKDGSPVWVDVIHRVVDWQGKPAIQGTYVDVSDQVALEQELRAKADAMAILVDDIGVAHTEAEAARRRAEEASAAKSRFLAIMSHELRTPLAGVMGMVDLLMDSRVSAEQRAMLRTLKGSAVELVHQLDNVFDLARIDANELTLEINDFSLHDATLDTLRLHKAAAAEKGLGLSVSFASSPPERLRGDAARLQQVLSNLIGNAVKYTTSGAVAVSVDLERSRDGGGVAVLEVSDSGIGIPADQHANLFVPFHQVDLSTTRRFGGTGLGLAICKRLVEAMHGSIALLRSDETGSTFQARIPLLEPLGSGGCTVRAVSPHVPEERRNLRVLLADDNDLNRMVIGSVLRSRFGFRVTSVTNGEEAVEAASSDDFDVVVMDMQMPVMDGCEATRRIRSSSAPLCSLPIIALTADTVPDHHDGYLMAGAQEVLTKPVDWSDLGSAIRRHAERHHETVPMRSVIVASRTMERAVLDDAYLDNLIEGVGLDLTQAMVKDLPASMRPHLASIRSALEAGSEADARRALHALAGLVGTFGTVRLHALCVELENEPDGLRSLQQRMPEFLEICEATQHALANWVAVHKTDWELEAHNAEPAYS
ncbi:PAS domain S-box-containing protein [Azospirillum baldaniorum]|uniref:ATP-binding protein n=1 Tax=Azospirillum baldaniorum TaxID=1064539 RepID=UPI0011A98240|nr:ATP-binding protein [Azospirillum baldaniorum]TWA52902.1 PAS domain S-box-containing protein [Azospirillum baldaniorum]